MSSNSSCSGRWRRRVESPHDDHRKTSHSKRLEAHTDVPFELRSSRLLVVSSRLLCSISNVELHCSLENNSPARNSRADTNCTENSCARSISARIRLFRRAGDLMTSGPPKNCVRGRETGAMPATRHCVRGIGTGATPACPARTAANRNIHVHTKKLTEI